VSVGFTEKLCIRSVSFSIFPPIYYVLILLN
jgi:hypothetical protein